MTLVLLPLSSTMNCSCSVAIIDPLLCPISIPGYCVNCIPDFGFRKYAIRCSPRLSHESKLASLRTAEGGEAVSSHRGGLLQSPYGLLRNDSFRRKEEGCAVEFREALPSNR